MKTKQTLTFVVVLLLLLPGYIVAVNMLHQERTPEQQERDIRNFPFHQDFYYVAAGEFAGLIADFLYLDVAATLGGRRAALLDEDEWDKIEKIFTIAVHLDPYFEPTFRAIQAYLTWSAKRPLRAIALLEKVNEKRTWHWMPPFYIGFNHYFFLKDNWKASHNCHLRGTPGRCIRQCSHWYQSLTEIDGYNRKPAGKTHVQTAYRSIAGGIYPGRGHCKVPRRLWRESTFFVGSDYNGVS